jgi:hypothetical protein
LKKAQDNEKKAKIKPNKYFSPNPYLLNSYGSISDRKINGRKYLSKGPSWDRPTSNPNQGPPTESP